VTSPRQAGGGKKWSTSLLNNNKVVVVINFLVRPRGGTPTYSHLSAYYYTLALWLASILDESIKFYNV